MSDKLMRLRGEIAGHLERIADMFAERPKITLIIRMPWLVDGGVVLSDDTEEEAIAELQRLGKTGQVFHPDEAGEAGERK